MKIRRRIKRAYYPSAPVAVFLITEKIPMALKFLDFQFVSISCFY